MAEFDVTVTITVTADSKAEAMDIVRNKLDVFETELSPEVEAELFAELGVEYD